MANIKSYILEALLNSTVSFNDLSKGNAKNIFASLKKEEELIVMDNNKPIGVLLSIEKYKELTEKVIDVNE